eukprot:CAMPEP_0202717752 /NCGR_PEP_ID=MMETSP1385-20130828/114776_1 /ASSEMBLY_ACC=CAM_ASM_000861 /TAXON_ID=933848 /ORGANISM="Elphidium margaritaceum" /LENGTH=60 /DNA_ID=CAMNT_0049380133 /DNA_START=11 /DNA_END=190 /DNA_ORIENTATION=+
MTILLFHGWHADPLRRRRRLTTTSAQNEVSIRGTTQRQQANQDTDNEKPIIFLKQTKHNL